ncbi:LOW QUALITY PROTEIN: hypothetical protein ACHAXH_000396, partial [Discostella pseudostelligera]
MSLSTLEKRVIRWMASNKVYGSSGLSAAAAVVGSGSAVVKGSQPSPSPSSPPYLTHENISKMRSDGICHCNRRDGHKFKNCGQFLMAGYVVEFFESDSDGDDLARDVGVGGASYASAARNSNSTSALYPAVSPSQPNVGVNSVCIGSSSHVAASHATLSSIMIADSGATDHMWPDYSAFTSYRPLDNKHVTLADNNMAPVAGIGSIKVMLGGHVVGVRDVLHVPSLRVPLYSLRAHRKMDGCGFIGNNDRFHVYFPSFVAMVDDAIDSHIPYAALGRTSRLPYEFRQPRLPASTSSVTTNVLPQPATIIPFSPSENVPSPSSSDEDFPPLPGQVIPSASRPPSPTLVTDTPSSPVLKTPSTVPNGPSPRLIMPKRISQEALRAFLPDGASAPPPIRPCDTPNGSDTLKHLTANKIYRLFGHRHFRNYPNFCFTLKDSTYINDGEPVPSLGEFATIPKRPRGAPLPRPRRALEKVHIDIVFGDGLGRLGYRYALIFVDWATRYIWVVGLKSLHADALIAAFAQFGLKPVAWRFNFGLIVILSFCLSKLCLGFNGSDVASAPAGRQSSNGLVERNWGTMVEMARSYLTDMQMPRVFWFPAIQHAAHMMNCIPGKINDALTTPFELLHHSPPDSRLWFPLFSVGYFHHTRDGSDSRLWFPLFSVGYFHHTRDGSVARLGFQAQTIEGIAIGRSDTSNAMLFYNPTTKQYYEPDTYKLDPSRFPSSVWPQSIQYDSGIFADLYRDANPHVPEPFPPGTRVMVCLHGSAHPSEGTITNIPLKSDSGANESESYMVLLDDGTVTPSLLAELRMVSPTSSPAPLDDASSPSPLPSFLAANSKIILAKDGLFHKGYLLHLHNGRYRFSVRKAIRSKREEWGVDLPSFPSEWPVMCMENRLIPSWIVPAGIVPPSLDPAFMGGPSASSILRTVERESNWNVPLSMPVVISASVGIASHVSAKQCVRPCPASLQRALDPSHPDRAIWNDSYAKRRHPCSTLIRSKSFHWRNTDGFAMP